MRGGPYDGPLILEKEGTRWFVYNYERGSAYNKVMFQSEDEACK